MAEDTVVEETVKKPEDVKPVDDAPAPVDPDPEPPKDDVRDLVKNLADKVEGLEAQIATIVETGGERDSAPGGSQPWTAKRWF
jgi:hypothetical protein